MDCQSASQHEFILTKINFTSLELPSALSYYITSSAVSLPDVFFAHCLWFLTGIAVALLSTEQQNMSRDPDPELVPAPFWSRDSYSRCPGPCPVGFGVSPQMQILQPGQPVPFQGYCIFNISPFLSFILNVLLIMWFSERADWDHSPGRYVSAHFSSFDSAVALAKKYQSDGLT